MTPPVSQVQVNTPTVPDTTSVITGAQTSTPAPNATQPCTTSMAVVTPSPLVCGSTTSLSMDSGPNTLLCQLMSTALACTGTGHTPSTTDGESIHTMYNGHQYQICHINNTAYCITTLLDIMAPLSIVVLTVAWQALILGCSLLYPMPILILLG